MRRDVRAAVAVTGLLLAGCGGGSPAAAPTTAVSPAAASTGGAGIDPALLQPLTALGPCEVELPPADDQEVAGLRLPDGAVVVQVTETDPLVQVDGYIPLTPVEVRVHYQERDDVEVVSIEDEGWESEALVTDGEHRLFVKSQAVCERGSRFVAVVAPEADAEAVPAPAQAGGG